MPIAALLLEAERGLGAVVRPAGHQLAAELVALALVELEAEQIDRFGGWPSGAGADCCAKAGEMRKEEEGARRVLGRSPAEGFYRTLVAPEAVFDRARRRRGCDLRYTSISCAALTCV